MTWTTTRARNKQRLTDQNSVNARPSKQQAWSRLFVLAGLAGLLLLPLPATVLAQETALLSHSTTYGQAALFRMTLAGLPDGTATELFIRVNERYTESETAVLANGSAVVTRDLQAMPLPPFASITYWWTYETAAGKVVETDRQSFRYTDDRFAWQTVSADSVRLHWITGERAAMEQALNVAQDARSAIKAALQTSQAETVDIYVYPTQTDLAAALQLGGHAWAGAVAYPELGVVLIAAQPNAEGLLAMQQDIPHELTHLALYTLLGSQGYAFLPTWLNEGLATYFEARPDPQYAQAIDAASEGNDLIPLATLCAPFPEDPVRAQLAYAQSGSVTRYLRQTYGWTAIRALLATYGDGQACDAGAKGVLDQDLAQLEHDWRMWLEQDSGSLTETTPATVAGATLFLRDTGPWLMLLTALLVPAAALVVAVGRRK